MIMSSAIIILALLGSGDTPRKFVEKVQEVQVEREYSPRVGRTPEPQPEPFVPVRYLTPEQRAEPIIVEPEPVFVSEAERSSSEAAPAPFASGPAYESSEPSIDSTPDYITSVPVDASGSATGSTAIPDYSM